MDDIIKKLRQFSNKLFIESDCIGIELDDLIDDIEQMEDSMIINLDNFKNELERAGLMTEELINFIDNYMRWDNK